MQHHIFLLFVGLLFLGCDEEPDSLGVVLDIEFVTTPTDRYSPATLDFFYARTEVIEGDGSSTGTVYSSNDISSNADFDKLTFVDEKTLLTQYTFPGTVGGIDLNFGELELLDRNMGEAVKISICTDDFVRFQEEVQFVNDGRYLITVPFDLSRIHEINGVDQLDLTGIELEVVQE